MCILFLKQWAHFDQRNFDSFVRNVVKNPIFDGFIYSCLCLKQILGQAALYNSCRYGDLEMFVFKTLAFVVISIIVMV